MTSCKVFILGSQIRSHPLSPLLLSAGSGKSARETRFMKNTLGTYLHQFDIAYLYVLFSATAWRLRYSPEKKTSVITKAVFQKHKYLQILDILKLDEQRFEGSKLWI